MQFLVTEHETKAHYVCIKKHAQTHDLVKTDYPNSHAPDKGGY